MNPVCFKIKMKNFFLINDTVRNTYIHYFRLRNLHTSTNLLLIAQKIMWWNSRMKTLLLWLSFGYIWALYDQYSSGIYFNYSFCFFCQLFTFVVQRSCRISSIKAKTMVWGQQYVTEKVKFDSQAVLKVLNKIITTIIRPIMVIPYHG